MHKASKMDLNFSMYFEPEGGINTPREFTDEIIAWANKEGKNLVILEESMEPIIKLDDVEYTCKLGVPEVAAQSAIFPKIGLPKGFTPSVGKFLGYKWVYLYENK